ncbi:hypothetical protein DM01DRAFT_1333455 [Hesseltinella vesiculosa]|uniref:Uncharacterized protein n=1 Tax=Hesseltinella vesiculosa TaxID=101127 RepID=A0A1X2GQ02_9FUNG|nr:hypothetical protein DM01DRAFT_1333455 [Hesseltinella vesiculosa]
MATHETKSQRWFDKISLFYDMEEFPPPLRSFQPGEWYWLEQNDSDDVVEDEDQQVLTIKFLNNDDHQWTLVETELPAMPRLYADMVKLGPQVAYCPKPVSAGLITPRKKAQDDKENLHVNDLDHSWDAALWTQYKSLHRARKFKVHHRHALHSQPTQPPTLPQTADPSPLPAKHLSSRSHCQKRLVQQHRAPAGKHR